MKPLIIAPYFKSTSQHSVLSRVSSHPSSVHAWPRAEITRVARNSSNDKVFRMYSNLIRERWQEQGMDPIDIKNTRRNPFEEQRIASTCCGLEPPRALASGPVTRLVLDVHFALEDAGVHCTIKKVLDQWSSALECLGLKLRVGVAWRGAARPLAQSLRVLGTQSLAQS